MGGVLVVLVNCLHSKRKGEKREFLDGISAKEVSYGQEDHSG